MQMPSFVIRVRDSQPQHLRVRESLPIDSIVRLPTSRRSVIKSTRVASPDVHINYFTVTPVCRTRSTRVKGGEGKGGETINSLSLSRFISLDRNRRSTGS